jgi:hypothetical protein
MRLFFFLNNWKSGTSTRPTQPYTGGYDAGAEHSKRKAKSLFSQLASCNDTKGAVSLDDMDDGRHIEAPSRDPHESRSRILRKGAMVTQEYSVTTPVANAHVDNNMHSW